MVLRFRSTGLFVLTALTSTSLAAQEIDLQQLSTNFNTPIGIDYHEPSDSLILSANYPSGQPNNLERIEFDGSNQPFSALSGLTDELKIGTVRSDGNPGGFVVGDVFIGNGNDGEIVRITDNGATVLNPWVSLPGPSNGLLRGSLYIDRTGVFGGDLIACTTGGEVWRIDNAGTPTLLVDINVFLEGMATIPNDPDRYGPIAGTILCGAEQQGLAWSIDTAGTATSYNFGVNVEDVDIIPANESFFGVNFGTSRVLAASSAPFAPHVGDILLTQEFAAGTGLYRLTWDGASYQTTQLTLAPGSETPGQWEHVTFAPVGVVPFPDCTITPSGDLDAFVGLPFSFDVSAVDAESGDVVTLTAVGLPPGATTAPPLPAMGNPVDVTIQWTPTIADIGSTLVTFVATDSSGLETVCDVSIEVSCNGSFDMYGAGLPGLGGAQPTLTATGCPIPGAMIFFNTTDGRPDAHGCIIGSVQPASVPLVGGTLLVAPPIVETIVHQLDPIGETVIPFLIPLDLRLVGEEVYFQAGYIDDGAIQGFSMTNGLQVNIGG